jgi:hypothetical protein
MKRKTNSFKPLRSLLLTGLLAAPMLAFNATAQNSDSHWSPLDVTDDGNGPYAYFEDSNNWDSAAVPDYTNATSGYVRTMVNQAVGSYVTCVITNSHFLYQIMIGAGGGGYVVLTNGASVVSGVNNPAWNFGNIWTGLGFPNGPSTISIGPGCRFTTGDHLWVGQGTANGGPNYVIINGGTLDVHGQLGVGWNGGTNYITLQNGGHAVLNTWASQTLGAPGNLNGYGVMNIADNTSSVIVTNNQTGQFAVLTNNNQLLAYGGAGVVTWTYNPSLNITTISAVAPVDPNTPVIVAQPTNAIVSPGATASFHVQINNVTCNYQWYFNGNPLTDGGAISGSKTATLSVSGVAPAQSGNYFVIATNTAHADHFVQSSSVSLSSMGLNLYPVITINGVPGNTYAAQWSSSLNPAVWTTFSTVTVNSFGPLYVVDTTSPMAVTRLYRIVQQ